MHGRTACVSLTCLCIGRQCRQMWENKREEQMTKSTTLGHHESVITPLLGITLALVITIGIGFLMGQQSPTTQGNIAATCRELSNEHLTANCLALRSTVATEEATSISRWSLWVSFGSLLASAGALGGLIFAFLQGQRTIILAAQANQIASENNRAQARAYVVVQSVECNLDKRGRLTTIAKFQNSGLSPARRLRWHYNARLDIDANDHERQSLTLGTEPDLDKSHWRRDIASAQDWLSTPTSLTTPTESDVDVIKRAEFIAVTVKIVADYQDVFGTTHKETACFQGRLEAASTDSNYTELDRALDSIFDDQAERTID